MHVVATYPKAARLRRRREFLTLQGTGVRRHAAHFVVIRRVTNETATRLGVTVSSRVGNAVARNRTKRLIREVFRRCRARILPVSDILVIAKPGAPQLTHAQVASEIERALGTSGPA